MNDVGLTPGDRWWDALFEPAIVLDRELKIWGINGPAVDWFDDDPSGQNLHKLWPELAATLGNAGPARTVRCPRGHREVVIRRVGCDRGWVIMFKAADPLALPWSEVVAAEAERRRVARELHDGLSQLVTALSCHVYSLPAAALEREPQLRALAEQSVRASADLVRRLRAPEGDGLEAMLTRYTAEIARRDCVRIDTMCRGLGDGRPAWFELTLFRALQDAIATLSAGAEPISVLVTARDGGVRAVVEGRAERKAMVGGLEAMRDRLARVGGHCRIQRDGDMATITLDAPDPRVA